MISGNRIKKRIKIVSTILLFGLISVPGFSQTVKQFVPNPPGYFPGDPLPDHTAYLTFDDGPSAWTELVLNTLKEKHIKATFFVSANWDVNMTKDFSAFNKYKRILQRMVKEGHTIGNHTRYHRNLALLDKTAIEEEFDSNQRVLNRILGDKTVKMNLLRPPFGSPWISEHSPDQKKLVSDVLSRKGYVILWSRHFLSTDSMDWVKGDWYEEGPKIDITRQEFKNKMLQIYDRLIRRVDGKGMVVLFHDTHRTSTETLPRIIDKLVDLGYKFDTINGYINWKHGAANGLKNIIDNQ